MSLTDQKFVHETASEMKYVFGIISKLLKGQKTEKEFDESSFGYFIARLAELNYIKLDFKPIHSDGKIPMYFTLMMSEKFQSDIVRVCDDNDFLYEMLLNAIDKNQEDLAKKILDKGVNFDDRNSYFKLTICSGNGPISGILRNYRQPEKENFFHRLQIDAYESYADCLWSVRFYGIEYYRMVEDEKFVIESKKIVKKKFRDFNRDVICLLCGILPGYDSTIVNYAEHREKSDVLNEMINYKKRIEKISGDPHDY